MSMMPSGVSWDMFDALMGAVKKNVSVAMHAMAEEEVARIKGSIGRQFPPSGTPPFPARRTGQLQRGVGHIQDIEESAIHETIFSVRPPEMPHDSPDVPEILETGSNGRGPYRYMGTSSDDLASRMPEAFANKMGPV